MSMTLDSIGLKNGTDKSSFLHNYLKFYEDLFAPLRLLPITIMEIGVYKGASLQTWREYFPNAKIVGVDIQPGCKQFEGPRVTIELADQSNVEHLAQICMKHGPFDIIIDDGSHMWEHQITSLRYLFPFVKDGGFYVVEDLQTNYGTMQAHYKGRASQSCVEYLKLWMDAYVADEVLDIESVEDPFLRTYGRAVHYIQFHRHACAIRKKFPRKDWRVSAGPPLAAIPAKAIKTVVNAHFGVRGDIFGPAGYVDEGSDAFTIQGFALESEARATEYRVRFPDGVWSEWFAESTFAGTRGKALPISGFAVRCAPRLAAEFEVNVLGRFVGGEIVEARGGEDCVGQAGTPLRALQVVLTHVGARLPAPAPQSEPPAKVDAHVAEEAHAAEEVHAAKEVHAAEPHGLAASEHDHAAATAPAEAAPAEQENAVSPLEQEAPPEHPQDFQLQEARALEPSPVI